jgi:hypothetical protein
MTREPYYNYFIRSEWYGQVETPVAIGVKFLATLDALSGIDPIFKNWLLADFPNPSSGDPDVDGLEQFRLLQPGRALPRS